MAHKHTPSGYVAAPKQSSCRTAHASCPHGVSTDETRRTTVPNLSVVQSVWLGGHSTDVRATIQRGPIRNSKHAHAIKALAPTQQIIRHESDSPIHEQSKRN